jgi:hypothetical protein
MRAYRIPCTLLAVVGLAALYWGLRSGGPDALPENRAAAQASPAVEHAARTAPDGFGYAKAFAAELKKIGQITPQQFAQRYALPVPYAAGLSWDPTKAKFWDRLNEDPKQPGVQVRARGDEERWAREIARKQGKPLPEGKPVLIPAAAAHDFRLNAQEVARYTQNGFVVSERLGAPSCTEMYYRIYKRDLPVFVSTDAVLHAWHRSYDALLEEIETTMLIPSLREVLGAMTDAVPAARRQYGQGPWADSLRDADYFLTTARSLLAGTQVKTALGQEARVAHTLTACDRLELEKFALFGKERYVDFSQFKPRGHYEKSEELKRYFRAMMWCGRIDLRVAGNPKESSPREMAAAVALHDLLQRSGRFARWQQFDAMIRTFVGKADSMTFAQLGTVLAAAGVRSPADLKDEAALAALQARVEAGKCGDQEIRGDAFCVDASTGRVILPRSFTFLGQRFAIDSWVTAKVVYDDVWWDGRPVKRRIPSCLDVAFAAFGNDNLVPALARRMTDQAGREFRDGLNYQHNLAAVRQVIDGRPASLWGENLYTGWLGCLRELSRPTTGAEYPEAMRTAAWAMKSANTQLASWTQLRHDTILYVKQSYTAMPLCYYPAGYVEPLPHFWARTEQMVARAARQVEDTPYDNLQARAKHAKFLRGFAGTVKTLRGIAEKELAQKELSKEETKFLEEVVEVKHQAAGCVAIRQYAGWYPRLFYLGGDDSAKWDALAADVHTDTPAPDWGDPGCVLHEGVGGVDLLVVAVDSGKDRVVYAGPVLSHYEFEMPRTGRKADSEWKADLRAGHAPPRPEWTRSYLVPGVNPEVKNYPAN